MTHRIEKIKASESWKLQETQNTKKDKRDQPSEEEKQNEGQSSFEEKMDIHRLITKETGNLETISLSTQEIKSIWFKSFSTSREQIIVEAKLTLHHGIEYESVWIAVPRTEGLKLIHCKLGEPIPMELLTKDDQLKFSIPTHFKKPIEKSDTEKNLFDAEVTIRKTLDENKIADKFKSLINIQTVLYAVILLLSLIFIYLIYRVLV